MKDKDPPTVSVVMAVYNGERFLQQAMQSILRQTFTAFELIVVDDGSTDRTPVILDRFADPRMIRITNPRNIGQTRSLNLGLAKARGRLIARHDADDLSDSDRFAQQAAFMEAHPAVGLLGTAYTIIDGKGRPLDTVIQPLENREIQKRLQQGNTFCHGSVMMRADILAGVGGYNENFPVAQDYELWLRLAEQAELANLPDTLYQFRFDKESVSRTKRERQLAFKQLAWSLAQRRRSGQAVGPLPEDVLSAFPPDRNKLYLEARGISYLYYVAGQLDQAERAIHQAYQLQSLQENLLEEWQKWALSRAIHLADTHNDLEGGEAFLKWLLGMLEAKDLEVTVNTVLGEYYVDRAFKAYQRHNSSQVRTCVRRAISYDRHCLQNRGLWSISLKSMIEVPRARGNQ